MRPATLALLVTATSFALCDAAGAAQLNINISPSSGPAGTAVSISGAGCSPGVSVDANNDYVRLVSTLFTVQVGVRADGSWHTTAIVGGLPVPGPAPITATCVTDGAPSQETQYNPAVFTVTSGSATPTTAPGTTPTTKPGGGNNGGGGSNGGGANGGGGGAGTDGSNGADANGGAGANGDAGAGTGSGAAGSGKVALSAKAKTPKTSAEGVVDALGVGLGNNASANGGGSSGIGWLWWLLLIVAAAAGIGLAWTAWHRRREHALTEAEPV